MNAPAGVVPARTAERRPDRHVAVPAGYDVRRHLSGLGAALAGNANVIMQLSWPGVGYGVMNSRVHDGSAMLHPIKRARTTFTYLAVATLGSEAERTAYRRAVNGQHAKVVSTDDEPVQYRALDPRLQTWVAACLYYGTRDIIEKMHGPLPAADADALYAECAKFGTTLQMPADAWPATRADFDAYWETSLGEVRIDRAVRDYLLRLTTLANLRGPARRLGNFQVFVTTGFLPERFRAEMGLPWNGRKQRRFDRLVRTVGRVERTLPTSLRIFPFNALLLDLRWRMRTGRRLV